MYLKNVTNYFYYFDEELFDEASNQSASSDLNVTSHSEDEINGTITVTPGMTEILTTIPYDEGWIITANGKEVDYDAAFDTLISLHLDEGEYEINMVYRPDCVKYGSMISGAGIVLFIVINVSCYVVKRWKRSRRKLRGE